MKYITEDALRTELRACDPEYYAVPEGKRLTPAAREYLQSRKIRITGAGQPPQARVAVAGAGAPATEDSGSQGAAAVLQAGAQPQFTDYETGAYYTEKPEYMTHLSGNVLVHKCHPRILFRGKLDSLQASVVLTQVELCGSSQRLVSDLTDILKVLREIMRCDVLDEPFRLERIIGLTHDELREQSHDPRRFFGVQAMVLPDYTMGKGFALLNSLRAAVRETETAAVAAFREGARCTRGDLIEALNRMSSAVHILMCRYLAGQYQT